MTTIAAYNSDRVTTIRNSDSDTGKSVFAYLAFAIKSVQITNDVVLKIIDDNMMSNLSDREIVKYGMISSEKVLDKIWDSEDDDYWNSFL